MLITNKQSNILEDLDTLRLLSKLVPEFCANSLEEEAVCLSAFDLIFAFDEVISLGHKENITIMQVKQNCEMDSHEEKLHKMIIQVGNAETLIFSQGCQVMPGALAGKAPAAVGAAPGGSKQTGQS